ncbi:MAG: substrate-binding domain-containing protein [Acidobacteriota bacterium]
MTKRTGSAAAFAAALSVILVLALVLPACRNANGAFPPAASAAARPAGESLSLSGAWALYPLAVRWQEEFQKSHPGTAIDVQAGGAGKGIADVLAGAADIGMVSREIHEAETAKGAVALAVAKDAVVATISRKNPFLDEILRRGLRKEDFTAIWIRKTAATWEGLLGRPGQTPIHVYTRSDACGAAETWAAYLGGHQEDLGGVGVYGDPGLAEAVRRDPLGIGFNNVNFAYDAKSLKPVAGLEIAPIDIDGNGLVDPAERVYAGRDDLTRAIAAGAYPSPPARDLYFVIKGRPDRPLLAEFLAWVLTEGQKYVPEMGYIGVGPDKIASGLAVVRAAEKR